MGWGEPHSPRPVKVSDAGARQMVEDYPRLKSIEDRALRQLEVRSTWPDFGNQAICMVLRDVLGLP